MRSKRKEIPVRISAASASPRYAPSLREVRDLIALAKRHPLGLEYLKDGALDSVAAAFAVHAFVVERARARLGRR